MKSGALFIEVQLNVQKEFEFEFFFKLSYNRVTADSSLRSPTGGVEGLYPTPHIHEQMTAYIMATSTATLSTTL